MNAQKTTDFFQRVDRIISGDIKIKVERAPIGTAMTNLLTKTIYLDFSQSKTGDEAKDLSVLKGLNYHELAHQLFTVIDTRITDQALATIANQLEDGRIETLFSRKYPRARDYFETTFLNIIWRQRTQASPNMFLACRARRLLLDVKYPAFFETLFSEKYGEEVTQKVKKLIDDYLVATNSDDLFKIAKQIQKLLNNNEGIRNDKGIENKTTRVRKKTGNKETESLAIEIKIELSRPEQEINKETIDKQKKIKTKSQEGLKQQKKIDDLSNELNDTYKEEDEKREEYSKKTTEMFKESDDKKKEELKKERDKLSNKISDLKNKKNVVRDQLNQEKSRRQNIDLSEIIEKDIEDDIEENIEIHEEEINRDLDTIAGIISKDIQTESDPSKIHQETKVLAKELKSVFEVLKNDNKRGKVNGQRAGTVNIQRAMTYKQTGDFKIFNKTISDYHKKQRMGIIILVDNSGSMMGAPIENVIQGAWAVKEGLKNTDNKIAVIAYNGWHKLLKGFNDEGDFSGINASGGTVPYSALQLANKMIKSEPTIKNWLMIIMTDGGWTGNINESHEEIEKMNKIRVETVLISTIKGNNETHKCKHKYEIHETGDLRKVFTQLVETTRKNINNGIKTGVI